SQPLAFAGSAPRPAPPLASRRPYLRCASGRPASAARSYQSAARAPSGVKPPFDGDSGSKNDASSSWACGLPASAARRHTRKAPPSSPAVANSLPLASIASGVGLVARYSATTSRTVLREASAVGGGGAGVGDAPAISSRHWFRKP